KTPLQKTLGDSGALNAQNLELYYQEGLIIPNEHDLSFRHKDRDWVIFTYNPEAVPYNELPIFQQYSGVENRPHSPVGEVNIDCVNEVFRLEHAAREVVHGYEWIGKYRDWRLDDFVFKKYSAGAITAIAINVDGLGPKEQLPFGTKFPSIHWTEAFDKLESTCVS
ncbi:hypothetical protein FRC03_006187, partial [Tulasnella sp. 419]